MDDSSIDICLKFIIVFRRYQFARQRRGLVTFLPPTHSELKMEKSAVENVNMAKFTCLLNRSVMAYFYKTFFFHPILMKLDEVVVQ